MTDDLFAEPPSITVARRGDVKLRRAIASVLVPAAGDAASALAREQGLPLLAAHVRVNVDIASDGQPAEAHGWLTGATSATLHIRVHRDWHLPEEAIDGPGARLALILQTDAGSQMVLALEPADDAPYAGLMFTAKAEQLPT